MKKYQILQLGISGLSYKESLERIIEAAKSKASKYICFANVHMSIEAVDSDSFTKAVNEADLVCADGMPLVKAVKIAHKTEIDRVAGMDMMPSLLEAANKENLSVFFFGGTDDVLEKIVERASKEFKNLSIVGAFSPPFKKLSEEEKESHRELIRKSGAHLVFVALGCPKQELWMAENSEHLNAVLLGVGGAFPVYANIQKRAPQWMRNFSLEWLYRFMQDPKRLFKRYFYTNTKFLYLFWKSLVFKKPNSAE